MYTSSYTEVHNERRMKPRGVFFTSGGEGGPGGERGVLGGEVIGSVLSWVGWGVTGLLVVILNSTF